MEQGELPSIFVNSDPSRGEIPLDPPFVAGGEWSYGMRLDVPRVEGGDWSFRTPLIRDCPVREGENGVAGGGLKALHSSRRGLTWSVV